jgi:hypothetical protein
MKEMEKKQFLAGSEKKQSREKVQKKPYRKIRRMSYVWKMKNVIYLLRKIIVI